MTEFNNTAKSIFFFINLIPNKQQVQTASYLELFDHIVPIYLNLTYNVPIYPN